ncbi:phospholipase A and acyltransferase 3-like [Lampris incognitus]|uniref:phospholipase A and acyltransferase 3-like n=1 Tax=Lampris incognitus TaxID=2546036 RepID=UPI0024B4898C|nr:phospholipase A and acyltransferase 3-like [Lampris incognitus]XP_056137909.1 phospholipase A and acyltransferase 3-like [Lampris incognitus]
MAPTLYDEKPEPGDLVEIFRGSYQHWAVYVGEGYVVHLAPPSEASGAQSNSMMSAISDKAIVKKEGLWDLVKTDQWVINNDLDKDYEPRPVRNIIRDALSLVGTQLPYCVLSWNCEHFVNELRYGKGESRQVRKAGETLMYAGAATAIGIGIVALAGAFFGGKDKEKKNKH